MLRSSPINLHCRGHRQGVRNSPPTRDQGPFRPNQRRRIASPGRVAPDHRHVSPKRTIRTRVSGLLESSSRKRESRRSFRCEDRRQSQLRYIKMFRRIRNPYLEIDERGAFTEMDAPRQCGGKTSAAAAAVNLLRGGCRGVLHILGLEVHSGLLTLRLADRAGRVGERVDSPPTWGTR